MRRFVSAAKVNARYKTCICNMLRSLADDMGGRYGRRLWRTEKRSVKKRESGGSWKNARTARIGWNGNGGRKVNRSAEDRKCVRRMVETGSWEQPAPVGKTRPVERLSMRHVGQNDQLYLRSAQGSQVACHLHREQPVLFPVNDEHRHPATL